MNVLLHVIIDHIWGKYLANFEVFFRKISLNANLLFLKYVILYAGPSLEGKLLICNIYNYIFQKYFKQFFQIIYITLKLDHSLSNSISIVLMRDY